MKKNWAIRKDAEAVSPVIATILMVAITVVLAAVLYVMVLGFGGSTSNTPAATYSKDTITNGKKITIVSITNKEVPWDDVTIQLADASNNIVTWTPAKADLNTAGGDSMNYTAKALGSLTVCAWVFDLVGNGVISGGDSFNLFTYGGATTFSGSYTVNLLYEPTGERIGTPITWS